MSLKLVALFLSIAGVVGMAVGYYLRLIISLGKKGSMELEIKEMLLTAKEDAKKITADAEAKTAKVLEDAKVEIKNKEISNEMKSYFEIIWKELKTSSPLKNQDG